jgi:hypothetical protein
MLPQIYAKREGIYAFPLEKIKEDLTKLKHAIYTDPHDQSPWFY